MTTKHVIVIGAGVGGLAAAADLARLGMRVTVLERAATPGGKMRTIATAGGPVDGGPTVFTMRWIFESLFNDAGRNLDDALTLRPASILARHAWRAGGQLDLFADIHESADAIGHFAGAAEARGYRAFCARSAAIYQTLAGPFIESQKPGPLELVRRVGLANLPAMLQTAPFATLWGALRDHFKDPRLLQLFGRYATYCGSSPFAAPATLMLVAHVEQAGVWQVQGGMHQVARALESLGASQGAAFRYNAHVAGISTAHHRVTGVTLAGGEYLPADAVVFNGDCAALPAGLLGDDVRRAAADVPVAARSLSAITWCLHARTSGFALLHHTVFFAEDYAAEFRRIFHARGIVAAPTVYICAQDRDLNGTARPAGPERLLLLINAPADGDRRGFYAAAHEPDMRAVLSACGLHLDAAETTATTPAQFDALFPASGGALYGRANHGGFATFARPGAATQIGGLFLAGGSVHPGPGIPMAAMSGRLAAAAALAYLRG